MRDQVAQLRDGPRPTRLLPTRRRRVVPAPPARVDSRAQRDDAPRRRRHVRRPPARGQQVLPRRAVARRARSESVCPYEATSGWRRSGVRQAESKRVAGWAERSTRRAGRRKSEKVLKESRSRRERGRTGTSVKTETGVRYRIIRLNAPEHDPTRGCRSHPLAVLVVVVVAAAAAAARERERRRALVQRERAPARLPDVARRRGRRVRVSP